jgi:hypothetical protein
MTEATAAELIEFWARGGVLDEASARSRLAEVVCVLRDSGGAITGSNSVYARRVDAIGGRAFWIYRSLLPDADHDAWAAMVHHAFHALEADYRSTTGGPIGLCLLVDDPPHPEAAWSWPAFMYAGYSDDGQQLRIRYFDGAVLCEPRPVCDVGPTGVQGYRVDLFDAQDAVTPEAVVEFWTRTDALPRKEAERRVSELLLVAGDGGPEPAAVMTAYLGTSPQLGMELWYLRVFVADPHRFQRLAWTMTMIARDELQARFMSGRDTRGQGVIVELQNPAVRARFDDAVAMPADYAFINETPEGYHVRVHYFPGAQAPGPPSRS